ncbi:EamA family transporter [Pseudonocardia adelaidensis]|uniref:EamA family transporter n=1 Tax=Pseudonocardia adelaidensis TaxID=648754 RepID=A0ABP9NRC3_9PSEU
MVAVTGRTGAGLGLAVVSAVTFGLSGPLAKALTDAGWSAGGAVLVRLGGAAAILLVLLALTRPGVLAALRADGPALVLYGALAVAGVQVAFFHALLYVPVAIALLLEFLGPILVLGWVGLVRRQRLGRRTLAGAVVALFGLSLVVQVWTGVELRWEGLAWGLGAAVCQASYFLVADRAGSATPPVVLAGVGMTLGTALVAVLGFAGVLPIVIDTTATGVLLAGVDVGWFAAAAMLVVVSSVIAYLAGVGAIARIGASRGSLVALLEVVASALASWLLLGQVPTAVQAVGGALILGGVALTIAARRPAAVAPEVLPAPAGRTEG